jgi:hypothetical protein
MYFGWIYERCRGDMACHLRPCEMTGNAVFGNAVVAGQLVVQHQTALTMRQGLLRLM